MGWFSEPTPDDVLAKNLRDAAASYNKALKAALAVGLNVSAHSFTQWGRGEYLGARTIQIDSVERTHREKF